MGLTYIESTVRGPEGEEHVTFLIDSGAKYSLLPERVWRKIGLREGRGQEFRLADGSTITRTVSECEISLPQGRCHTPVVLGEPEDPEALLGVVTLEELGLVFDPFRRVLDRIRVLHL
ncbi:MAG: aspartyl protease [Gemmatimonadetes bacterium]|nr:MAG: aspartyl protease [Gemmatimonadota bacterium]